MRRWMGRVGLQGLVSVALCLVSGASFAEQSLDLASAVKEGLANSFEIKRAEEALNQSKFQKHQARSTLFPRINLQATGGQQKDSVADKTVGSVPFGGEAYNRYDLGIRGEQTLLRYGMFSGVGHAEYQRQISHKNLEIARRDLVYEVVVTFYQTMMNEALVKLLEEQENSVKEILSIAQRRMGLGGKRIDVLHVRTRLALLKPIIQKARNGLAASTAKLATLIGQKEASQMSIRGSLKVPHLGEVEKRLDLKNFEILELKRLSLEREQVGAAQAIALGNNLPKLSAVADYRFASFTKAELLDDASKSWSVKLVLDVPLFSGLSSLSERRALIAQDAQLEAQERNVVNSFRLNQIRSRKELETAHATLASSEEAAKLSKDSLNEAKREYRNGLIDFLQYFQIETANFEAETSVLEGRLTAIKTYLDYFVFSGQPVSVLVEILSEQGSRQ